MEVTVLQVVEMRMLRRMRKMKLKIKAKIRILRSTCKLDSIEHVMKSNQTRVTHKHDKGIYIDEWRAR